MNFMELARSRFAVRKFSDRVVEEEKLAHILEVGNLAPTAKNNQPQRIYVLKSEESLKKLAELTHCGYGAGLVLLFTYNADEDWKNPQETGVYSGVEDVSIVATHIMLAAAVNTDFRKAEEPLTIKGSCCINSSASKRAIAMVVKDAFSVTSSPR